MVIAVSTVGWLHLSTRQHRSEAVTPNQWVGGGGREAFAEMAEQKVLPAEDVRTTFHIYLRARHYRGEEGENLFDYQNLPRAFFLLVRYINSAIEGLYIYISAIPQLSQVYDGPQLEFGTHSGIWTYRRAGAQTDVQTDRQTEKYTQTLTETDKHADREGL